MNVILDAGALIAIDRDDRRIGQLLTIARRSGALFMTSAPIVTQVTRNGARQALLSRALRTIEVRSIDQDDAKYAGEILAKTRTSDAVDALLAVLVASGDQVLTSNPEDISTLLTERRIVATIVRV